MNLKYIVFLSIRQLCGKFFQFQYNNLEKKWLSVVAVKSFQLGGIASYTNKFIQLKIACYIQAGHLFTILVN